MVPRQPLNQSFQGLDCFIQSEIEFIASIWKPAWGKHFKIEFFFDDLFFRDFLFLFLPIEFFIFSEYFWLWVQRHFKSGTSVLVNQWLSVYLQGTVL